VDNEKDKEPKVEITQKNVNIFEKNSMEQVEEKPQKSGSKLKKEEFVDFFQDTLKGTEKNDKNNDNIDVFEFDKHLEDIVTGTGSTGNRSRGNS